MKKTIILLLILTDFSLSIKAQSFILKNNQEKIEFQKLNFKKDSLKLIISKNEKTRINYKEVKGYYSFSKNTFFHQKHGFIERVYEGEIKLYKKIIEGFYDNSRDITLWFVEKENNFKHFFPVGKPFETKKKEGFEIIKSMVNDDSKSTNSLKNKSFKYKVDKIIKIIKDYNLRQHKIQKKELKNSIMGTVIFFRDNKNQNKATVSFMIGDKNYFLDKNEKIEIDLPASEDIMVCINNESINTCELINPSSYFKKCYEINFSKNKKGSILKKNSNSSYLKARFKYFDKKQTKK